MQDLKKTKLKVEYYKLKEQKFMEDGHSIDAGQELIFTGIKDGVLMLFETFDNTAIKRIFWEKPSEVVFVKKKTELWSQERIEKRQIEIFGDLTNK